MLLFSKDTIDYATQIFVGITMPYVRWNDFKEMPGIIPEKAVALCLNSVTNSFSHPRNALGYVYRS